MTADCQLLTLYWYYCNLNLLFICSRNQWRSPTAESIFDGDVHRARSAGMARGARIRVSEKLIRWADMIFVMERKHRQRLLEQFGDALEDKPLIVLDIPDAYGFGDEELIRMLRLSVQPHLDADDV